MQRPRGTRPASPWKVGAALFAGLSCAFALLELAFAGGRPIGGAAGARDVVLAELNFLLLAYAVAARLHVVAASRRALAALAPALALAPAEVAREVDAAGSLRGRWAWGVAGALVAALPPLLVDPGYPVYDPRRWTLEVAWHRVTAPLAGWWLALLLGVVIGESRRLDRLTARLRPLDVFDLRPFDPFVRQGLTHALVLAGACAIGLLFLVEDRLGSVAILIGTIGSVGAALGLLLPLRGARARLRATRNARLASCRAALASAAPATAEDGAPAGATPGRFADLAALEARLLALGEWPFDASTLLRFALYLALPLGSWAGGAVVERVLETLLDR